MPFTPRRPGTRTGKPAVIGAALGVLVAANLLNNRFAPRATVPTSVVASALLLAIGRRSGASWNDLGLSRGHAVRGLRYGAVAAGGVGALYATGAALPATRALFADQRAAAEGSGVLRQALVDVPLGTVLLEETGFRGVLPALLRESCGDRGAEAVCAGLFGLWHILPSGDLTTANPALTGSSRTRALIGSVLVTTVGGGVFGSLRARSGSVIAPMTLHTAINSLGYAAAWLVTTRRPPTTQGTSGQPGAT